MDAGALRAGVGAFALAGVALVGVALAVVGAVAVAGGAVTVAVAGGVERVLVFFVGGVSAGDGMTNRLSGKNKVAVRV